MTFQLVRGFFESDVYAALTTAGVPATSIFWDNVGETPPTSGPFATVNFSFGTTVADTTSCEGLEDLRGQLSVNVYTPKNQGSKAGEDICLEVMKSWHQINADKSQAGDPLQMTCIRNIEGPTTIAPDQRPHHVNNISCSWMARAA